MSQYRPCGNANRFYNINRYITADEYNEAVADQLRVVFHILVFGGNRLCPLHARVSLLAPRQLSTQPRQTRRAKLLTFPRVRSQDG